MDTIRITKESYDEWKPQIIAMEEACFKGDLLFTDEEIEDMVLAGGNVFWLDNGKIIACTYYQPINTMTFEDFYDEDYGSQFDPASYKHQDAIYINSTSILPEYRGKGLIDTMKTTLLDELRQSGHKYVIGHAHDGVMWHVNQKYGAEQEVVYDDWYGEGKHYLYEINLWRQRNDYCCGAYALSYFCKIKGYYESPYLIQRQLPCRQDDGTSPISILNWFRNHYVKGLEGIDFLDNSELGDIKTPCIVNYQYEGDGHYGVIVGVKPPENLSDFSMLEIYNPATGDVEELSEMDFYKHWYSNRYGKRFLLK